jgi:hypothetical protein
MTKICALTLFVCTCAQAIVVAQDSPTPTATPLPTPTRSVRVSFVPPPLDGKISLGIYNEWDQLVRILHQEAELDEFTVGADALITKWDGKDKYGYDAPTGKYSARGFLTAPMKIEETAASEGMPTPAPSVRIKLVANALEKNARPTIEISVGFDDENSFLQTRDGLPLVTIALLGNVKSAAISANPENKSVFVFLTTDAATRIFRISGVEKMMAFDAGEFELK